MAKINTRKLYEALSHEYGVVQANDFLAACSIKHPKVKRGPATHVAVTVVFRLPPVLEGDLGVSYSDVASAVWSAIDRDDISDGATAYVTKIKSVREEDYRDATSTLLHGCTKIIKAPKE